MASSLVGVVKQLLEGHEDPTPRIIADSVQELGPSFEAASREIDLALGPPLKDLMVDHDWFYAIAPESLAGRAWRGNGRYLLLLAEPHESSGGVTLALYVIAEDDMDE